MAATTAPVASHFVIDRDRRFMGAPRFEKGASDRSLRSSSPAGPPARSWAQVPPGIISDDQQAAALMAEPEQEQASPAGAVVTPLQLYDVVQYHVYQTVTQLP
jgi:hypothetical protein